MTEKIINTDGSRNWEANILLDNVKRLEQENKKLKEENITAQKEYWKLEQGNDFLAEKVRLYRSALEEISGLASPHCTQCSQIINIINEVLQ